MCFRVDELATINTHTHRNKMFMKFTICHSYQLIKNIFRVGCAINGLERKKEWI